MAGSIANITKKIEGDKIDLALKKKLEAEWLIKESSGWSAYVVIVSLNKLVFPALKNKSICKSNVEDIYALAEICCNVDSMWDQDRLSCMQCTYHVMRYLLNQKEPTLAKKLCKYFFDLRKRKNFVKWEEKEILVLSNIFIYFLYYINDISKDINKSPYSSDSEVLKTFNFILKISELNDFASTSHVFQEVCFLSRGAQNLLKHDDCVKFSMDLLSYFLEHLKVVIELGTSWSPKEENISYSMNFLCDTIFCLKSSDFSSLTISYLFDFMKCLKRLVPPSTNGQNPIDFDLLDNTLKMCLYSTESSFHSYFEKFCKLLTSKPNSKCFPFIHACLSTFRSKIGSLLFKDDAKIKQLFPGLLKIYIQSKSNMAEDQRAKRSELLHGFTNALYFLNTSKVTSLTLASLFKYVGMFFKEFESLISGNKTSFEFGVNYCINVIQTFSELELFKEVAALSKILIKCILQLDPEFLSDSFEVKLSRLLNFFVNSFHKMGLITEAQIGLIAFVGVHPKFIEVVFKYWAELKVLCQASHQKESTCYSVIISEKNMIEEKWPPCKVDSINIEQCLLMELRAYSKHRELQIGPVVSVYRVASKLVKDKPLLVKIVTAAVDAISSDEYIPTLKNLHLSLENVLTNNLKLEAHEADERKLCWLRLALGDIIYQLIRCDIVELRKKAEDELSLMNLPTKEDIPIIEGEATVTPAYTCLKVGEQAELFEKMNNVLYYWQLAGNSVTQEDIPFIHFRYMKGLAYIFRLYSYKTKEIELWENIYQLAKKISNNKYQVLAVTELLILMNNVDENRLKEVEELVRNEVIISKKSYIYSLFFVNLGKNLFMNQKFDEAKKVIEELDEYMLKRHFLVNAQYKSLLFSLKRDKLDLSPNRAEFTLYILVQIFESILFLIKNSRWKTFCEKCVLQWLFLEYSCTISKMYYDLRLMRHARCYAKKQLIVAQRLALPIKVCEFLILLGLADLQTGNRVDANEKLSGLDSILELDTVRIAENPDSTEICYYFATSLQKDINQPKFSSHPVNCNCLICDNVDFLLLTLEAFILKGIFTSSAGAHDLSKHIFAIGQSLIDYTNEKVEKCYSSIPNRYNETKVRFYLNLTVAQASWGDKEAALTSNGMVQQYTETCSRVLQKEVAYQSAALDWLCYEKRPLPMYKPKLFKDVNDNSMPFVKTPEHAKPQSSILAKGRKMFSSTKKFKVPVSPRPTLVKKCIFEDSEDSIDEGISVINKENFDAITPENKSKKDKTTLAVPLPLSPCNSVKKTICFEKSENLGSPKTSDWCSETPKEVKKYTTRAMMKAQTEKKKTKNGPVVNLFSTPFPTKTAPEIKIFCDEDNVDTAKTVKRRGRPPKGSTTVKKSTKKEKKVDVKLIGRRKLFDSDTEEELKPAPTERKLFSDTEEFETTEEKKNSFVSSDESAIIEASFIEKQSNSKVNLPLTPSSSGLESSLKQLSISDKKDRLLSLSTRNMRKLRTLQETPQSSQAKFRE